MKKTAISLIALLGGSLQADVKLPTIFADHMVLQQKKPVQVWGWADANEKVSVSFGDQSKTTTADASGNWNLKLDPLNANATPQKLTIKGNNEIVLNDVLVGEVWVASGQSNMQWSVRASDNPNQEIAAAKHPNIRLFTIQTHVAEEPRKQVMDGKFISWKAVTPESIPSFSAVAYYFGRDLQKHLNVPIGLINTSWGGTRAEAWTSKPALDAVPSLKAIGDGWKEFLATYDVEKAKAAHAVQSEKVRKHIENVKQQNAKPGAVQKPVPAAPRGFQNEFTSQHRPSVLFNSMISPIVPFTVKGAIWYQGESNASRADQYLPLMETLIKDWRNQWKDDFSFYIVQLAGFASGKKERQPVGSNDNWAELQWTQWKVTQTTPKTGLAVTNDIGTQFDIHPPNKQDVGHRLALQALAKDYGKSLVKSGPTYKNGAAMGNKFVVSFDDVGSGLAVRGGGELTGFWIAGPDKVWKTAKAKIEGKQVHVWSDEITNPSAVRYAWESWVPDANLINKEGLPAGLFRTDSWELSTKGKLNPWDNKPAAPVPAPAPQKKAA